MASAGASVGRIEVNDVAKEDPALVELIPPDDDSLECERALAESRDHGLTAGLDALRNGDLALARQEFYRSHLAEIHAHGVIGALGGFLGPGLNRNRMLLDLYQLVFVFLLRLLVDRRLFLGLGLLGFDHVDAHLVELRQDVLDLFGLDLLHG